MNITFDRALTLHITHQDHHLAMASLGLFHGGDMLVDYSQDVNVAPDHVTGNLHLENNGFLHFHLTIRTPRDNAIFLQLTLTNPGGDSVSFDRIMAPTIHLDRDAFPATQPLWTMQGASVYWGQDFAFPLYSAPALKESGIISLRQQVAAIVRGKGFSRENFLGHLQDGEGGGIPVVYFWNPHRGLAMMHLEPAPKDWYMPVKSGKEGITTAFELHKPVTIPPGGSFECLPVILSAHQGDFFEPLALYRELLAKKGVCAPQPVAANFEPAWCSWGYEFDIKPDEMTGVLPALNEMGIRWLTLDDRWFDAYGDWNPREKTFPGGVTDIQRMNDAIHAGGAFSQLWWYPLCAEDGHGRWESHWYGISKVLKDHPDWVILNADGSVARNNRHLAMLCPALPEVQEHIRALTTRFIQDWGFDGHKLDNIYTIPPCHNPVHRHNRPEESTEAMATAYRIILDTTRQLRPNSVTQICSCGTPITLHLIPATDQTVTADPTSSEQIRQRIKFYKALMGPRTAVFADHVELSDGSADFASEMGAGGVPGTKFIWPNDEKVKARLKNVWELPPEKQALWKKWFTLYNEHRPAEGEYLNLYDLAFHYPEAHAISKDGRMYYAFYANYFQGSVELRGLGSGTYRVTDYVNGVELRMVSGDAPTIDITFEGSLMLIAEPVSPPI
ncbi:MAG TPA: alpha-galactosidase [Anaerolineales bacterium]|nr:alpha-galactosidase [Anaerolineales bacterium]